jgi:hypothetical protein
MASNTKIGFETALKNFLKATENSKKFARIASELALEHFADCGDVAYLQAMYDAMNSKSNRNYVRKVAFLRWLWAHAPVKMENNKLFKDKSQDRPVDLDKACAMPFWDFSPDPEQIVYEDTDVVKALQGVIKRFDKSDRYTAKNEAALAKLNRAKEAVAAIAA